MKPDEIKKIEKEIESLQSWYDYPQCQKIKQEKIKTLLHRDFKLPKYLIPDEVVFMTFYMLDCSRRDVIASEISRLKTLLSMEECTEIPPIVCRACGGEGYIVKEGVLTLLKCKRCSRNKIVK